MNDIAAFFLSIFAGIAGLFAPHASPGWGGYVEGDTVYVAPAAPGTLTALAVTEGQAVKPGDILFSLSMGQAKAALDGAEARVKAAEAHLQNLTTGGREADVDVVRASLKRAEAELSLAADTATRTEGLYKQGLVPLAKLTADQASLKSAEAAVSQLEAQLKVAELPARDAQQAEAEASLAAARADAERARADLADRTGTAPAAGKIEAIYFHPGEVVAAGTPVLSLLPYDGRKIILFLPEAARGGIALGDKLSVTCDGCPEGLVATLSRMDATPEFTPPVIYSRDERSRLVFRAEARIDADLAPGQPVTVELLK